MIRNCLLHKCPQTTRKEDCMSISYNYVLKPVSHYKCPSVFVYIFQSVCLFFCLLPCASLLRLPYTSFCTLLSFVTSFFFLLSTCSMYNHLTKSHDRKLFTTLNKWIMKHQRRYVQALAGDVKFASAPVSCQRKIIHYMYIYLLSILQMTALRIHTHRDHYCREANGTCCKHNIKKSKN
jgi:hypothetical protein